VKNRKIEVNLCGISMPFNTEKLDAAIAHRRATWEQERQVILAQVLSWLNETGKQEGIRQAYVFGSLTKPGKFTSSSDVDLAIVGKMPDRQFELMSELAAVVGREVDMIELERCHFKERIRQTGVLWTATP
jgi:hypothetical protein